MDFLYLKSLAVLKIKAIVKDHVLLFVQTVTCIHHVLQSLIVENLYHRKCFQANFPYASQIHSLTPSASCLWGIAKHVLANLMTKGQ